MPKPRKPSNVLALTGALKHDPARYRGRANEPIVPVDAEIGPPPDHLSPEVVSCWVEIVGLAHPGTLCSNDRLVVEHGARLLAELRAEEWKVPPVLMLRFEMFLSKMGMTPADRSRVSVLKPKANANPLDEFKAAG